MTAQDDRMRVLVADDEPSIRFVLQETLESLGHEVKAVDDGESALRALQLERFDLAFLDIRMPGLTGLEVLKQSRAAGNDVAIVLITAQNLLENAVESMKAGALDYLVKPFALAAVKALAEKALATRALKNEVRSLRRAVGRAVSPGGDRLVGSSTALLEIFKTVGKVAPRNVPVLITGESGTGKELVARAVHNASPRAGGPFVAINCAAVPQQLLESELFGHARGAFTDAKVPRAGLFLRAHGGTLFLDEIGEMPLEMQPKLLRALQERVVRPVGADAEVPFDARIIAATNRDLETEVYERRFREDLYYRVNVVGLRLPPLRERGSDVLKLAQHFLDKFAPRAGKPGLHLSPQVAEKLLAYEWPGNVRELENSVERMVALARFSELTVEDLPEKVRAWRADRFVLAADAADEILTIDEIEKRYILRALKLLDGNKKRAAELLGLKRTTFLEKMKRLDLEDPGDEPGEAEP